MAELKKQHFGNIKGTFGNAVFRQRNGKNYIAQKPVNYTPPNTEEYFKRISKFKIATKISSVICSDPDLRDIWIKAMPKYAHINVYNYLISIVYPYINENSINNNLKIVPDSKVGVRLESIGVEEGKLLINLYPLTEASLIDTNVEKSAKINTIVYFSNPINSNIPFFDVVNISSSTQNINLTDSLTFESLLSTTIQSKLGLYEEKKIFSTLLTYNEKSMLVNYSSTICTDLS
ncbi:MAG: hypothetical protein N2249_01935 [Melioribacter sp.]|nr:hypothetical protein [Melioribacter sp.]